MDNLNDGQVPVQPAPTDGQVQGQPAQEDQSIVNQYLAEQPATQPDSQSGQAQGQVNTNTQGLPESEADKQAKFFQSQYNKEVAEKLALQRQLQMMANAQQQPVQTAPQTNPFDPNTQYEQWDNWRMDKIAERVAQSTMQRVVQYAQTQAEQQQEVSWQQAHPDANIEQVKFFAQQRGIRNLDDAYTILTLPQARNQVIQQTANNMAQQFRQTNNGAIPIRTNSSPTPQPVGLSYEKMAKEYNETNGAVAEKWTPQMRALFEKETFQREGALRHR